MSMFLIMGCFMGVVMAGIGGFNAGFDDEINSNSQTLAGVIIGLCILVLAINVCGMCILCTYGTYFGVIIQRRYNRGVFVAQNMNGTTVVTMAGTNNTGAFQNNPQVETLQAQNRLLQQQIELQQQMINQQQQQQQAQYGFQQPPAYGMPSPAYPPAASYPGAPPPSYDKVA